MIDLRTLEVNFTLIRFFRILIIDLEQGNLKSKFFYSKYIFMGTFKVPTQKSLILDLILNFYVFLKSIFSFSFMHSICGDSDTVL